jgi:tRNA(Ile)-lysidine synthase
LLAVPKARLAAFLAAEGQPSLHDPSNLNPAFERVRLRLGLSDAGGIDEAIAESRANAVRRIERERGLNRLLARFVALHSAGFAVLDAAALEDADLADRLLSRIAACIGGATYPARRDRVIRLRTGLIADRERARTLGGCRFVPWRGRLLVLRELAAASRPIRLDPGADLVWDRRIAATLPATARNGFTLGYLGQYDLGAIDRYDSPFPRLLYSVLPALWDEHDLAAVPHLGQRRSGVGVLPELYFRPANPLTRGCFTVV